MRTKMLKSRNIATSSGWRNKTERFRFNFFSDSYSAHQIILENIHALILDPGFILCKMTRISIKMK
jgi:hypothetical protein